MIELSDAARATAGIAVLAAITVTSGGHFLTRVARRQVPATEFQQSFFRAGHGHAGVLIVLGLVCLLLSEATALTGLAGWLARTGVLGAAVLLPAGFFLSAIGRGRTAPSRWVALLWAGALLLVAALATLGIGLLAG